MNPSSKLLNIRLAAVVTGLRHGEMIVVADAGLPVPPSVQTLDLAVTPGNPSLREILPVLKENLVPFGTPSAWPRRRRSARSEAAATAMTMPSPRR